MYLKKTSCLLLTLALISLAVPAFADGNPPPIVPGGEIHPWDNNDGNRASYGPFVVHSGWMWLGHGSNAGLIVLPRKSVSQWMKSFGSKSDKAIRKESGTQVGVPTR